MGIDLIVLLDTATLVWATATPERLTDVVRSTVEDDDNVVFVSAASAWEIATKHRLGRLAQAQPLVDDWQGQLDRFRYVSLHISAVHALHAGAYAVAHADPFDRIIAAQAELEEMTLVASDRAFDLFPVTRLW